MSQHKRLLLLLGISTFRTTGEDEAVASLTDEEARLPRTVLRLDTRELEQSVATGFWPPVQARVRAFAKQVLADLHQNGPAMVRYIGIDDVPTLVALAAFLGDEHRIECRDYAVDLKRFEWLEKAATVAFETAGVPRDAIETAGDVALRIEVSYTVHTEQVDEVVAPTQRIADVTIRPRERTPIQGLLRSQADVDQLRVTVREVLAELDRTRPGIQTIHLFLAGPISACLAVGQELRLRNGRRVQTYRHRSGDSPPQTPAILLTPRAGEDVQQPLTPEELVRTDDVRQLWREALDQVREHAKTLQPLGEWPVYLAAQLGGASPCPVELAPIWKLVRDNDVISQEDVDDFSFDRTARAWFFPNRMLLSMATAGGDADRIKKLARAFFWHEYLHDYQYLTQHTAPNVGAFANCLERLDYIADAYGTLHQVDYLVRQDESRDVDDSKLIGYLKTSITEAIDAFWTFEPPAPIAAWQARRLRRYLNWYWRRIQIAHAADLSEAMSLLCRPPVIELAGPPLMTEARRVFMDLGRVRESDSLELALIDEKNRLRRFPSSANLSISALLEAFRTHNKQEIDTFFESLIDHARPSS